MPSVHVFISTGRFKTVAEMRDFVDQKYTRDGDGIPSQFMSETGLENYEPMCIEAIRSTTGKPLALRDLLRNASYASQWLQAIEGDRRADAALCVFSPNVLATPAAASVEYVGEFRYAV